MHRDDHPFTKPVYVVDVAGGYGAISKTDVTTVVGTGAMK